MIKIENGNLLRIIKEEVGLLPDMVSRPLIFTLSVRVPIMS